MDNTDILATEIDDIDTIKSEVLKKISELAFDNRLDEADTIAFELIPGVRPRFRCCVYREREIIRQRVRMAMGKLPTDSHYKDLDPSLMVHVISSACEGCPIARYTVTDNCQNCLTHKCIKVCPFGAISRTPRGSVIDKTLCRNCGKCAEACPYSAIVDIIRPCVKVCPVDAINMDKNDIAVIDKDKCINCGACVTGCPFGAISDVSMITNVINLLLDHTKKVYAVVAPSIQGQFGKDISLGMIKGAILNLGFDGIYEAAEGADSVAYMEAKELLEFKKEGKPLLSSCCPSFFTLVENYFPELKDNVSTLVPPMASSAIYIKNMDPDAEIVFIGPCISKKADVLSNYIDIISAVLTFEELVAMLRAKRINIRNQADMSSDSSSYGKGFARSGGVAQAIRKVVSELEGDEASSSLEIQICDGSKECINALKLLKHNRLRVDFVEGMCCTGGCIAGPSVLQDASHTKKLFKPSDEDTSIESAVLKLRINELDIHRT